MKNKHHMITMIIKEKGYTKMKKIYITLMIALLASSLSFAQEVSKVGTTSAVFLGIDVGARAVGRGGAFVASAEDVTGLYWNPAGIARIDGMQVAFSHSQWIADVNFNFVGIAAPLQNLGTIGVNATFVTMDDIERTTILQPMGTGGTFSAGSYAIGLTFARELTDRFSIGMTAKYITENIYNSSARGFAIDIGTLFTTRVPGLKIGMNISNYGTKMQMSGRDLLTQTDIDPTIEGNNYNINANLATDAYDLPLLFRVGISYDLLNGNEKNSLVIGIDANTPNDDVQSINLGGEYLTNLSTDFQVAVRGGYKSLGAEDSQEGLAVGGGVQYKLSGGTQLKVDYAWQDFGVLNNIQKFTLGYQF